MPKHIYRRALLLFLLTLLLPAGATAETALHFFAGPAAPRSWTGPGLPALKPVENLYRGNRGLTMPLPMQQLQNRAYWDAAIEQDLSPWRVIAFDIQIDDPTAVNRAAIYFRSGDGWYGGWFEIEGTNWQSITLSRADFHPEGTPAGWNRISSVRISFWKQDARNTTARIANFRATNVPILILRNTDARGPKPDDAAFADRLVERLQLWFRQYGIAAAIITDDELRAAPPAKGTRLLLLPYNPVLTKQVSQRLEAFTRQGGKLIATYALNETIAPLLEIDRWQWMRAEPSDAFAFLHFAGGTQHALPERVAQDSWNINRPFSTTARVLATWQNGQGQDSGIPAVTLATNGVYIGHVLTNIGRQEKMRMLMALIALLVPDLAPQLSAVALQQATTLLDHSDWDSARAFILQTARNHRQHRRIAPQLEEIDRDMQRLQQRIAALSYPQVATHAANLRQRVQSAYYTALRSRNADRNEFRGVWAHDAAGIRGLPWSESVAALKAAGINHLFANLLWGGAAFYPSEVLPTVSGQHDFAREVTAAGKQHGVKVHAWMVLWSLQHAPDDFVATMRAAGRLQQDHTGKELPWLCPSHPENRKLTTAATIEIVQRYPLDGFHLDYIRFPDANACFCSGCRQRFETARNLPLQQWPADVTGGKHRPAWLAWRRGVIDTMVAELHQAVKRTKPEMPVSAAVWSGWPSVRDSIGQDWPAWGQQGWIDFFTPMNYVASAQEAVRLYRTQREAVPQHIPIYPGLAPSTLNLPPATVLWHIDQLRETGAPGFILFDLDRDLLHQHLPALGAGATR